MIRLVAIDLDGTLLNSAGRLSDGNAEALRRAAKAGIVLAPATARWYQASLSPFAPLGLELASIASGGSDVRAPGGAVIEQRPLSARFASFVAELCDRAEWNATLATPGLAFRRANELPAWAANAPAWLRPVTHLRDLDPHGLLSVLIELSPGDPFSAELEGWDEPVSVHRAVSFNGATLLTVTAPGVDKGTALLALCKAMEIDAADAVVIGDSEVDLPMFRVAGHSVAMANASADVQAAASSVTASADEDGVARALERLL